MMAAMAMLNWLMNRAVSSSWAQNQYTNTCLPQLTGSRRTAT